MAVTSHYATLGVAEGADPDAVRQAYLDLARRLHPDHWVDAGLEERADTERHMQAVNEAWRVLGNPARRLAYDVERREAGRRSRISPPGAVGEHFAFATGDLFAEDVEEISLLARFVRALPWIVVLLGLGGIFVFTAYATSDGGVAPVGGFGCVLKDGDAATDIDCGATGAQQILDEPLRVSDCPEGSEPFQARNRDRPLCLEPLPE